MKWLLRLHRNKSATRQETDILVDDLSQQITTLASEVVSREKATSTGIGKLAKAVDEIAKQMEKDGARLHSGRG